MEYETKFAFFLWIISVEPCQLFEGENEWSVFHDGSLVRPDQILQIHSSSDATHAPVPSNCLTLFVSHVLENSL
jgi:hypothetical protein